MRITIEVAPGELFDKLTILEIKLNNIQDAEQLKHIRAEWKALEKSRQKDLPDLPELEALRAKLKDINETLWAIEDRIRAHERSGDFNDAFIQLAREVYRTNDQRAAVKRQINDLIGTDIAEVKSYQAY